MSTPVRSARLGPLVMLALACACTPRPWKTHPMTAPPDRSCRTGSDVGYDVWIWECHEDRHTVIWQFCGGLVGCREAEREDAPCSATTAFERENQGELEICRPVPESQLWR